MPPRQRSCEYCGIPQSSLIVRLQVEHIIARQHQGTDEPNNLALSCDRCNLYKGTNLSAVDPTSGTIVLLFNPRIDRWHAHFSIQSDKIVGLTAAGRATAALLHMNADRRVQLRREIGDLALPPELP